MPNETPDTHRAASLAGLIFALVNLRNLEEEDDDAAGRSIAERQSQILKAVSVLNVFGMGNLYEPESLYIEPSHCFSRAEADKILTDLSGMEPADLLNMQFDLIDPSLVEQYAAVRAITIGSGIAGTGKIMKMISHQPIHYAAIVDRLYGMAIIPTDAGWRQVCLAEHLWNNRIIGMPAHLIGPHLKAVLESLSEGILMARDLLYPSPVPAVAAAIKNYEVPEQIVHTPAELSALVNELQRSVSQRVPAFRLWFRGQPKDYLVPDRTPVIRNGMARYSSVRDSSLIPSLFRNIDEYQRPAQAFRKIIGEVGAWSIYAESLLPPSFTIMDPLGKGTYTPKDIPLHAQSRVSMYFAGRPHLNIPSLRDLGPYSRTEILDENGELIDEYLKLHHPSLKSFQTSLLLQHYGCPTAWLDITHSPEIAQWFALHRLNKTRDGHFMPERVSWPDDNPANWPTIYVFVLHPEIHPLINTSEILKDSPFLRPVAQKCGLLGGAGNLARNYPARFIATKIRLGPGFQTEKLLPVEEVFPDAGDLGLQDLKTLAKKLDKPLIFPVYTVGHL